MSEMAFEVPGRMLGSFAELGGRMFYVDWSPEPRQVEGSFMWLADYVDNIAYPMVFSLLTAQQDTRERFVTETDPDGGEWPPLDPDYLEDKRKAGFPDDILHRTGVLEEDAPFGWKIVGEAIVYDVSGLPFYGPLHQSGTGDPSNIGIAFESRETARAQRTIKGFLEKGEKAGPIKGSVDIGRGQALPARPFIGLSPEAVEEIAMIFSRWYDRGPELMPWEAEPLAPTPTTGGFAGESLATTTTGRVGTPTNVRAFGGGYSVRGARGRFIGVER